MNIVLQIFLIICLFIFLLIIIRFLSKKRLNLKYTLIWLLSDFIMLAVVIFPNIVNYIGNIIGIVAPVNTIFLFSGLFSILIILTLTMIVSHMNNKIYKLTQMQALLEKRIRDIEKANRGE